jgi:hypothetical protein
MNRLTVIGLASLVAYGVLIASKYTGVVSAARDDRAAAPAVLQGNFAAVPAVAPVRAEPRQRPFAALSSVPRAEQMHASAIALDFRSVRDLKAFADELAARRDALSSEERYYLARALEECQFVMSLNEDLAAFSQRQRRQFLTMLTPGDPVNARRIAAYDASDNTQRCARFQGTRVSQKEIEELYAGAAQQGDARAQAHMLVAELNAKISSANRAAEQASSQPPSRTIDYSDLSHLVGLLETRDPEAIMQVGTFLANPAISNQLRIGPNGETPEAQSFLGAFTLVVCDFAPDCVNTVREREQACAYGGYCNATNFEEIYQNYIASPWQYAAANRYRDYIHTAINSQNWSLIGLGPKRGPITVAPQ